MTEVIWIAGTVITVCLTLAGVVFAWVRVMQKELDQMIRTLPLDYVPREQIDNRFTEQRETIHAHMSGMEVRTNERFDRIDKALDNQTKMMDRVFDELKSKVDKTS